RQDRRHALAAAKDRRGALSRGHARRCRRRRCSRQLRGRRHHGAFIRRVCLGGWPATGWEDGSRCRYRHRPCAHLLRDCASTSGKPPMEDAWMGKAVERIFLPLMRVTIPEIVDVNLPVEGVFHNLMLVSIKKSYPGQARKVMNAIWSLGQAMFTKVIVVVDE